MMNIKGKTLSNFLGNLLGNFLGVAMLAGLAAPTLAQAKSTGFFEASPQLIMKIDKAYKTDFQAAPPVQAQRQTPPRREAMFWWFDRT